MSTATITSKGQITIPKPVRTHLDLKTGDRLVFRIRDDGVVEISPLTGDLFSLCESLKPKVTGVTISEMGQTARRKRSGR